MAKLPAFRYVRMDRQEERMGRLFITNPLNPQENIFTNGRGTKTCYDKFHIIDDKTLKDYPIDKKFLIPVLRSSRSIKTICHKLDKNYYLFVCNEKLDVLKSKYPATYKWIMNWSTKRNQKGILLPEKFINQDGRKTWYYLKPEKPANIFISINPDKKLFFSYSTAPIFLNQRLVAIRTNQKDVELIAALLNSIVSLLVVELNGVSRNLGALDLNADFFKTKMKILDPNLLDTKGKKEILGKFRPLAKRKIENYDKEFSKPDRVGFDKTVLNAFGYDLGILPKLYKLLIDTVNNRVEMKNK